MPLQLPPQRSVPDPDRMLREVLSDVEPEQAGRGRTGRVLAGVAVAAVAVGVTAVAVPLAIHRQTTTVAAPTSPTVAATSAEPSSTVHPTPMQPDRPLAVGQTASLDHLTVTVTKIDRSPAFGILVRARVCVRSLPKDEVDIHVSWTPWSVTTPPDRHSYAELRPGLPGSGLLTDTFPDGRNLRVAQCAEGWIPFNADEHTASVTVNYADDLGNKAVWTE